MPLRTLLAAAVAALGLAACGAGGDASGAASGEPTIVVTTTVLGDVVHELVGDLADVATIMPTGANAHDFQASAQDAALLAGADAIVVNGGGLEAGLLPVVDGAARDGVPVVDALRLLEAAGDHHEADGGHTADDGHGHAAGAHFFTDPLAVVEVVEGLAQVLPDEVPSIDGVALQQQAEALVAELEALHEELVATLSEVPQDRRVLITDHDVLDAFAERYGFEIVATVIPTGSTSDGVSGGALAELASVLRRTGVPAIFVEQTASADLADTLAAEVGDVAVVPLHAESLGPAGSDAATYPAMMRVNARRIADALG